MADYQLPTRDGERMDMQRKLEHLGIDCSVSLEKGFEEFCRRFDCQATAPWKSLNDQGGSTFGEVFQFELAALAGTVPDGPAPAHLPDVYAEAHARNLAGLAFSGGGIRSATFNLGVIQALAELRLLRDFDYLSTVSGGGYIGGWLSKLIHHCKGDVHAAETELAGHAHAAPVVPKATEKAATTEASKPDAATLATAAAAPAAAPAAVDTTRAMPRGEPRAVQYLRRYSNYLTPRTGMFSADTWTLICTYLRNTMLNMVILIAWLSALFLLPRVLLPFIDWLGGVDILWIIAVGVFVLAVGCIAFSISRKDLWPWHGWGLQGQNAVLVGVCLPLIIAGVLGSVALVQRHDRLAEFWTTLPDSLFTVPYYKMLLPGLCYFVAWGLGWSCAQWFNRRDAKKFVEKNGGQLPRVFKRKLLLEGLVHLISAATALTAGTVLLLKFNAAIDPPTLDKANLARLATFGMPAMLILFGITITLMIGLVGRMYRDESREWWARQGAWTFILALGWFGLFACAFYLPPLLDWAWKSYVTTTAIAGAVSTLLTLVGLKAGSGKSTGDEDTTKWRELVAMIAPYAFSILAIALLTTLLQWVVAPVEKVSARQEGIAQKAAPGAVEARGPATPAIPICPPLTRPLRAGEEYTCTLRQKEAKDAPKAPGLADYLHSYTKRSSLPGTCESADNAAIPDCVPHRIPTTMLLVVCLITAFVLSWRVDINKFSLYMMYRLRLVRAYLGASTPKRAPHPFTGFDPQDDPPLAKLLRKPPGGTNAGALQRPYHLMNAAVNLVGGKELAWQNRKAGNFVFSPAFCGFELPQMPGTDDSRPQLRGAFRPTDRYAAKESPLRDDDVGVKLGTAVAVSGAAASPNMGYHSSLPLAFLMTLFNLRLGRWSPNPMRGGWERPAPRIGLFSLIAELLGQTDSSASFLYLSDGGHFENLGIYELVRRRCRLIVAVDATADNDFVFPDLGNAVRKCLTDFNIPILLNPSQIYAVKEKKSSMCYVTGTVRYSQADGTCADGVLLYIKPSIIGGENVDLFNYSKVHRDFPHQSTADQWFDESQFESYRILGYQAGLTALNEVAKDLAAQDLAAAPAGHAARIARMCEVLSPPASGPAAPP